jgi:hypothetical protein
MIVFFVKNKKTELVKIPVLRFECVNTSRQYRPYSSGLYIALLLFNLKKLTHMAGLHNIHWCYD